MNEGLSRLVAGLLVQAKDREDISAGISRIRAVIKKVIEGKDTIFGRLNALEESFREVIPGEKQRYEAAIKALSTTAKLGRQEIVAAFDNQLRELAILEKLLISTLPHDGPGDRTAMEARSQTLKKEISGLREKIAKLEKEEKEIAADMAGREKGTAVLEKAVREIFTDLGAEITAVRKMAAEPHAERAAQQRVPDAGIKPAPAASGQGAPGQIAPPGPEIPQRICPLCGAPMSFSTTRNVWQCFSCAYEEMERDEVRSKNRDPGASAIFPKPAAASEQGKTCRVCGGRMDYYLADKKWQCFSCAYEESGKGEIQSKNILISEPDSPVEERDAHEEKQHTESAEASGAKTPDNRETSKDAIFPDSTPAAGVNQTGEKAGQAVAPAADLKQTGEKRDQATISASAPPSELKQTCPMCAGRMDYYTSDRKWQCYSCGFEFIKNEIQDKSEEKSDHSNVLRESSMAESLFDHSSTTRPSPGYWTPPQKTSFSKKPPVAKTCPACSKKMYWYGKEKGWRCNDCGYERRI